MSIAKELIREQFRLTKMHAVYVVGGTETIARRIGDNQGCIAIRVGITKAIDDQITPQLDSANPVCGVELLFRFWCPDRPAAEYVRALVMNRLIYHTVPLRKSWRGLEPETDIDLLRQELLWAIRDDDQGVEVMDDDELLTELEHKIRTNTVAERTRQRLRESGSIG